MKKIKSTPKTTEKVVKTVVDEDGRIFPGGTWKYDPDAGITKLILTKHLLLQKFIDSGIVVYLLREDWTIVSNGSWLVIRIYKDYISVQSICIYKKKIFLDNSNLLLKLLVDFADETNTLLELDWGVLTTETNPFLPMHPTITLIDPPERIRNDVPLWLNKFRFVRAKEKGTYMVREPHKNKQKQQS